MKKIFIILITFASLISCRYQRDAEDTVFNEFKASTLLKKYEYFKDLSAAIDQKKAEIIVYESELANMTLVDKDDKFYYQQRKSELLGLVSIHNDLCAQYNSAMSKANYNFTNIGSLPQGATEILPREVKPYINQLKK